MARKRRSRNSKARAKQLNLFEATNLTFREAFKLATTKYKDDENVQIWVNLYRNGTKSLVVGKDKKKVDGLPPKSEFAKHGIIKSVSLRESGKVFIKAKVRVSNDGQGKT